MEHTAEQKSMDLHQPHVGTVDREVKAATEENNNWSSSTEGHIYKFLSNCRIRLLQKVDLIPCQITFGPIILRRSNCRQISGSV